MLRKVGGEGITEEEVAASDGNTSQRRQEGSFQSRSFLCFGTFCFFIGDSKTFMSFFFSLFKKYLVIWPHWIFVASCGI